VIVASAGVAVSRSWMAARRIEPRAFVGTFIILATLLVFGLLPLIQKHPPNQWTLYGFCALIVPLSFGYAVYQNQGLLRRAWEWKHPSGKFLYVVVASLTVILSKIWTDQQIRSLTESNPSLFPSAQQAVTPLNIAILALFGSGIFIYLFIYVSERNVVRYQDVGDLHGRFCIVNA
jgi:hypothetical protein